MTAATDDERVIFKTAWRLLQRGDLPVRAVRLIGVGISHWQAPHAPQADLFAPAVAHEHQRRLLTTIDAVNDRFGKHKLRVGLSRKPTGD